MTSTQAHLRWPDISLFTGPFVFHFVRISLWWWKWYLILRIFSGYCIQVRNSSIHAETQLVLLCTDVRIGVYLCAYLCACSYVCVCVLPFPVFQSSFGAITTHWDYHSFFHTAINPQHEQSNMPASNHPPPLRPLLPITATAKGRLFTSRWCHRKHSFTGNGRRSERKGGGRDHALFRALRRLHRAYW